MLATLARGPASGGAEWSDLRGRHTPARRADAIRLRTRLPCGGWLIYGRLTRGKTVMALRGLPLIAAARLVTPGVRRHAGGAVPPAGQAESPVHRQLRGKPPPQSPRDSDVALAVCDREGCRPDAPPPRLGGAGSACWRCVRQRSGQSATMSSAMRSTSVSIQAPGARG